MPALPLVRITILDDHRLFRQGLAFILQHLAFEVRVAEAGTFAELLPQLARELPDVLLLDMQMPDVDGMEATKRLLEQYPDLKIVVLSMHADDHFITHMLKLGARSYLPKDVDKEQLGAAIAGVLADGHHFTPRISAALMRSLGAAPPPPPSFGGAALVLTQREKDVLDLLCQGRSTGEIAEQLFISRRTVEGHRQNLLEKTGTPNAVSLALYAMKHGLLANSAPNSSSLR
ncbi:response regulator transcription factor [Hymenobacter sp. M29]|uniref:Response regulator transcription factor n=1 Tax=Hymenobacter mellowenesis TaxID=3063995 RepID=A0ABT9AFS7_9BACT|nr:response regulator transcription factor [Hymenobacter sp. M29]MDO7847985.1 response regulator transcription factor [Hymenobacter sp. M29]